jgi:cell division protein FtsZ
MTLHEAGRAVEYITERGNPDADVIFGAAIDNAMGERLQITLIATGIQAENARQTRTTTTMSEPLLRQPRRPEPASDRGERSTIAVPRDFEQRLAQVRGRSDTASQGPRDAAPQQTRVAAPQQTRDAAPQQMREPVREPVMSSAQAPSAGSLDIPTFLRRVRGSL